MYQDTRLIRSLGIELLDLSHLVHLSFRNLGANVIDARLLNATLANLTRLRLLDISNCCTGNLFQAAAATTPELDSVSQRWVIW